MISAAVWKAIAGVAGGFMLAGFVVTGLLKLENDQLHKQLIKVDAKLATCDARLQNIIEARKSDASIPDDLRDFNIPGEWLCEGDCPG